jgi:RecA-family ATPase
MDLLKEAVLEAEIEPTKRYKQLLEIAGDLKPKMIGIASSADVFAGSEIDRSQVKQFISLMTGIAIAANGAVALIAHPSLTGINTGTGLSGSTQWHNSVRARASKAGPGSVAQIPLLGEIQLRNTAGKCPPATSNAAVSNRASPGAPAAVSGLFG